MTVANQTRAAAPDRATQPLRVVDFHAHWLPREIVGERSPAGSQPHIRASWSFLTDVAAQAAAAEKAGIAVKVLSAPVEMLAFGGRNVTAAVVREVNDRLADAAATHGPRIAALATIDPFRGDEAAGEARRAVDELGLPGLVVGVASGELLLDAPQARPTLEFAAQRGVPIFAHPVNPPRLAPRFAGVERAGNLLARGTESAISTLALLRSGTLHELPQLRIVITLIGSAGLLLARFLDGTGEGHPPAKSREPSDDRDRLYVDTLGFDPVGIGLALAAVGPDHVVVGSDWPFATPDATPGAVTGALEQAGLEPELHARVAGANADQLLGLSPADSRQRP